MNEPKLDFNKESEGGGEELVVYRKVWFFSLSLSLSTYFVSCNGPWAPKEKWHGKEHIIISSNSYSRCRDQAATNDTLKLPTAVFRKPFVFNLSFWAVSPCLVLPRERFRETVSWGTRDLLLQVAASPQKRSSPGIDNYTSAILPVTRLSIRLSCAA